MEPHPARSTPRVSTLHAAPRGGRCAPCGTEEETEAQRGEGACPGRRGSAEAAARQPWVPLQMGPGAPSIAGVLVGRSGRPHPQTCSWNLGCCAPEGPHLELTRQGPWPPARPGLTEGLGRVWCPVSPPHPPVTLLTRGLGRGSRKDRPHSSPCPTSQPRPSQTRDWLCRTWSLPTTPVWGEPAGRYEPEPKAWGPRSAGPRVSPHWLVQERASVRAAPRSPRLWALSHQGAYLPPSRSPGALLAEGHAPV